MEKKFKVSWKNQEIIKDFIEEARNCNENIGEKTKASDIYCLQKLADFLGNKNIKDATENDLKKFFKKFKDFSGYNLCGIKFKIFYRWVDKINKRELPKRMAWFTYLKSKERDTKQVKKELITPEEYKVILENSGRDRFGMWQGLWELFWLSGARLGEIASMKIKDVEFQDDKVIIYVPESKTKTREIPLPEYPYLLERWINNHPFRNNPDGPLWISNSTNNFGTQISKDSISMIFWQIKKKTNIKQTLSVHNFRKTRATYMFNQRSDDGGLIYTDTQLALFFGWSINYVGQRRLQYDLNGLEELKEVVFSQDKSQIETFDTIKAEKVRLETVNKKEIADLRNELTKMNQEQNVLGILVGGLVQNVGIEGINKILSDNKKLLNKYNVHLVGDKK